MNCCECESGNDIHMHHVVPRSLGGTKMVPLCNLCHAKVHNEALSKTTSLVKKAMSAKKERGEKLGGSIPYGKRLTKDKKTLVENKTEIAFAKKCKKMKDNGMTLEQIAADLNNKGVLYRGKKMYPVRVFRLIHSLDGEG